MDKLDVLNRDTFVEQLVRLMNNLSDNKSSTCFAINGAWGCGKSFLLDILKKDLERFNRKTHPKINILLFDTIAGSTIIMKNRLWLLYLL